MALKQDFSPQPTNSVDDSLTALVAKTRILNQNRLAQQAKSKIIFKKEEPTTQSTQK